MMAARYRDPCPLDCKVYVGELGSSGTRHEIEEAFGYYGPLRNVWVARNPPGFAFVMFEDPRDARDAVRALDGKVICGKRIKAELSTGKSRRDKPIVSRYPPPRESRYNQRIRSPIRNTDPRREYHSNYREPHYEPREHYSKRYSKKHRSWSRSRSFSPPAQGQMGRPSRSGMPDSYNGHNQQNTNGNGLMKHNHHSRSRSRSPPSKSPRTESRYR